jgi:hypothetical protein
VLLGAPPDKASKGHHSIGDVTADLFNHQTLNTSDIVDTSDIVAFGIIYRGALNRIALNESRYSRRGRYG